MKSSTDFYFSDPNPKVLTSDSLVAQEHNVTFYISYFHLS